jgi:diacylglycerol kinase (ATP)
MAGRGRARKWGPAIETAFRAAGAECRLEATQRRGHGADLAESAVRDGWTTVVAVGGDGIVHEVVNGLMRTASDGASVPLGIIPVGSGNDFIKMLGLPTHSPQEAVSRILNSSPRQVDVGRVSYHETGSGPAGVWYFTNGIGVGFDAQVAVNARDVRRLRGVAIYVWALAKTLRHLRSPSIRVVVDGKVIADQPLVLTTVSNGPCHGGSFWLCPGAKLDDGELDVLVADARSLPAVLRLLPRVVAGKHLGQAGVSLHRGRHVTVHSETRLPIHADGEIIADWVTSLEIDVLPGRLTVLA